MPGRPRPANPSRRSPERISQAEEAQQAITRLAETVAKKYRVGETDIRQSNSLSNDAADELIGRAKGRRKSLLRIARAVAFARRVDSRTALREAARSLAFAYFDLFSYFRLDPSERIALAEAGLLLAEGGPASNPSWVSDLREFYDNFDHNNSAHSWLQAVGIDEAEARRLLTVVRAQLRLPEFRQWEAVNRVTLSDVLDRELQIPLVQQPSNLRVKSLRLRDYRGVPGELSIDFLSADGKARSCIIIGDNGVGKSSIVSAIEFACQDRIGRLPLEATNASPRAVNVNAASNQAEVEVGFNDNTNLSRQASRSNQRAVTQGDPIPKTFGLAPMSLQRADIVRFLTISAADRGRLFIEHFADADASSPNMNEQGLREALAEAELRRRLLIEELSTVSGVITRSASKEDFETAIRRTFFDGQTRREWEKRNHRKAAREALRFETEFSDLSTDIKRLNAEISSLSSLSVNYQLRIRRLGVLLGDVGDAMTQALHRITGDAWAGAIKVSFGRLSAVSIELHVSLPNGQEVNPEGIFSEGIQDLIAVLFFLEVAQAAALRGQARILILDDVMQSVDSTVRFNLLEYLIERFGSWQLFITIHDQLWREQVVTLLRRNNVQFVEREIRRWTPGDGPSVRVTSFDQRAPLVAALEQGNTSLICGAAGRLLEQIANTLSWTLPISVARREGDRYDLSALWLPVTKRLSTTSISGIAGEVNRWLYLRNLLGAHYNQWADSLSQSDADNFAHAILTLYEAVHCDVCGQWVKSDTERRHWVCRCGKTTFS